MSPDVNSALGVVTEADCGEGCSWGRLCSWGAAGCRLCFSMNLKQL